VIDEAYVRGCVIFLVILPACALEPLFPVEDKRETLVYVDSYVTGYSLDIAYDAADLWHEHGITFLFGDEGYIVLVEDNELLAGFSRGSDRMLVRIASEPSPQYQGSMSCMLAHYFGLALDLRSVGDGLLGDGYHAWDGVCPWTDEDEEELCRVYDCSATL
jgi:hypothetical protein